MICERADDYEPARDLFKAAMVKVKQNLTPKNECKYTEMMAVFNLSKQIYLNLIVEHADRISREVLTLQYEMRNNVSTS